MRLMRQMERMGRMILKSAASILAVSALAMALTGCATGGQPNNVEKALYNIQTNVVSQTNVVFQTNTVNVTNVMNLTNVTTGTVTQTNWVTQTNVVAPAVQVTETTNYVYAASPVVQAATGAAGVAGPWGTVAGVALSGLLAIFAAYKNNQANTAQAVAQTSQQAIATAKAVIAALPNGAALSASFNSWLTAHASDANLAAEVATVVDGFVDPNAATGAALSIIQAAATPVSPIPAKA